jgi:carbamate kinase
VADEQIKRAVIALGGNAIIPAGHSGTIEEQRDITRKTMAQVAGMLEDGYQLVITHGNGPIVGNILLRNESAKSIVPPMPLDVCGADSEGGLGYMIQQSLYNEFTQRNLPYHAITLITQVEVSPDDPAFKNPSKPIGPFYNAFEAELMESEKGWHMVEDAGRGYRRVVPSPEPVDIVEKEAVKSLVEAGFIVIAGGGGGVPVLRDSAGELKGAEVVIDKDKVSGLLAGLIGATELILVTNVPQLALDYKKPSERYLDVLHAVELEAYYNEGQFPPGSMGPKVSAILKFLKDKGKKALITCPDELIKAVRGEAGTLILP